MNIKQFIRKQAIMYSFVKPGLILPGLTVLLLLSCATARRPETVKTVYPEQLEILMNECYSEYPDVSWITVHEFVDRAKKEDWIIVDARSVIEQAISMIPGSLSIEEFESGMDEFVEKNILFYCTVGCRSGAYARNLQRRGFRSYDLRGGILAWVWNGKELITPEGMPTRAVHVYGEKWNVLPPGYEGGW